MFISRQFLQTIVTGAVLLVIATGCQRIRDWHYKEHLCAPTVPLEATPVPIGTSLNDYKHLHRVAAVEEFVIFQREWYQGGNQLGPEGRRHLNLMIEIIGAFANPIIIEPQDVIIGADETIDDAMERVRALNEFRRQYIIAELTNAGVPSAEKRVLIGRPRSEGLSGDEAVRTFRQIQSSGGGNNSLSTGF